jgi:tetratricopeptide (TPR) repeat protein
MAYYELGVRAMWAGELDRAVTHEQRACALLGGTGEQFFLAVSFWFLALSLIMLGRFDEAREAASRTRSIGEGMSDSRLQSYGWLAISWSATTTGSLADATTAAERAVRLAPDPLAETLARLVRGYAFLEQRDSLLAITDLERVVVTCSQMGIPYLVGWASGWLAEAERAAGRSEQARERAHEALTIARSVGLPLAAGLAHRTLGLLAKTGACAPEAVAQLAAAIDTFSRMGARYEIARTRLAVAEVAHASGDRETARAQLDEARMLFEALGVPRWVERANELGAGLCPGSSRRPAGWTTLGLPGL